MAKVDLDRFPHASSKIRPKMLEILYGLWGETLGFSSGPGGARLARITLRGDGGRSRECKARDARSRLLQTDVRRHFHTCHHFLSCCTALSWTAFASFSCDCHSSKVLATMETSFVTVSYAATAP